jgi:ubiquinone/menaquinone biosynthesis C-methylase UbiE
MDRAREEARAMSTYEDYIEVSKVYDETRVPIGVEILLGCLTAAGGKLSDLRLLDAGCGSGAYSRAVVGHVGQIDAVDLNEGMLSVARAKLAEEEGRGRIAFHHASVDALPLEDGTLDAAMINQVLHHLETGEDDSHPGHARVIAEMHRVLRPGGALVVNMATHEQLRGGFWYYDLVPQARAAAIALVPSTERLEAMLTEAGFDFRGRHVPLDDVMLGAANFDPEGPLDERWRKSDSIWALAGARGVAEAEARVREMQAAGTLETWFRERDKRRHGVGQFTFFLAVKPG